MLHRIIAALKKIIILADYTSVKKKWVDSAEEAEIKEYIDRFKKLKDQHRITDTQKKDINYWGKKEFSEFKEFVETTTKTKSKRELKKIKYQEPQKVPGAELVAQNADWLVYEIETYQAAKILGTREWCIVRDISHWYDYTENDNPTHRFYFVISRNRPEDRWHKIAAVINSDGRKSAFDALDKEHGWTDIKSKDYICSGCDESGSCNCSADTESYGLNIPDFKMVIPDPIYRCDICDCTEDDCDCCHECENSADNCTCCRECGRDRSNCGHWCENCENYIDTNDYGDPCNCCSECGATNKDSCGCQEIEKETEGKKETVEVKRTKFPEFIFSHADKETGKEIIEEYNGPKDPHLIEKIIERATGQDIEVRIYKFVYTEGSSTEPEKATYQDKFGSRTVALDEIKLQK